MIPHITQERRAEDNIHHTGRIEGLWSMQKRCEQMTGPATPSLITGVSPDFGGQKTGMQGPIRVLFWRHDANAELHQSRERSFLPTYTKINK